MHANDVLLQVLDAFLVYALATAVIQVSAALPTVLSFIGLKYTVHVFFGALPS